MTKPAMFNVHLELALEYLRFSTAHEPIVPRRAGWLDLAGREIRKALAVANAMRDTRRRDLCLRVINWLRSGLARCRSFDLAA